MNVLTPLKFHLFETSPKLVHGVFLRGEGGSLGPFASLNLGGEVGDDIRVVEENRALVTGALGVSCVAYLRQVHGVGVFRVRKEDIEGKEGWQCLSKSPLLGGDALFTTEKGVGLAILHADCQAAIFYDPVRRALGVAHAGWKGSIQNIYAHLIEAMQKEVGTNPRDLRVGISPSLGPRHAEYRDYKRDFPEELWRFQKDGFFDFWEISRTQLLSLGVLPENIEISGICTYEDQKRCFSYRRDLVTGRHATVAALI